MRRLTRTPAAAAAALLVAMAAALLSGCARPATPVSSGKPAPAGRPPSATGSSPAAVPDGLDRTAAVYVSMLRRFMTSGENSFSGTTFPKIYILSRARTTDPMAGGKDAGIPISDPVQRQIVDSVGADLGGPIVFVADPATVVETVNGCAHVRDGAILITFGPVPPVGARLEVGINGFVACLGAIWLTYVVQERGGGWEVTGTTGSVAIA
jgi:hypothetical protein